MKLSYNPMDLNRKPVTARSGNYRFEVIEVRQEGGGLRVVLSVYVSATCHPRVYTFFRYGGDDLQRLESFLAAVALNFDHPPYVSELLGRSGIADFEADDRGRLHAVKYLADCAEELNAEI